ncbi:uncharacterized protein LOC117179410 [Belonocnema kinseyi]|uniref:uncharacterized protein LOC117179410 n=1 Tax=Belonocnema kinseyi TaxID=2817044 RepID=UPI00143D86ED|nr:uncharacterized protein LOC117179410 [Belonocnema kinseyi]
MAMEPAEASKSLQPRLLLSEAHQQRHQLVELKLLLAYLVGSQPAVTSFAQHFGDPNINANLRWPAASSTDVTHVYNTPLQVPGPKITLGHLLSTLEHIASTQGTGWPHMSQALQHSQRMMEMSLEFQRGEIRRLERQER